MKILCIDYGMKRIGLAASDPTGTISSPFMTILNKGTAKNIAALEQIIAKERVDMVVLGLPLKSNNEETQMSGLVRKFGTELETKLNIRVDYVNEHYSSKDAEEHIRQNFGINNHKRVAELVDKVAASMLLYDYINLTKEKK